MDVHFSTQSSPATGILRAWLENLFAGVQMAFFRSPGRVRMHVSARDFITLAAGSLLIDGACSLALAGPDALFNLEALPSALLWVPLALLAGYLLAQTVHDQRFVLLIATTLGSIGIALSLASSAVWFALTHGWFHLPAGLQTTAITGLLFVWWTLAIWVATRRLTASFSAGVVLPALILTLVVLLPAYLLPVEPLWDAEPTSDEQAGRGQAFDEQALYAQEDLLRAAEQRLTPERAGVEDLYFLGFAPSASDDVFMKETLSISKLLEERFDAAGHTMTLISHPSLVDKLPIATLTSLRRALDAIGGRLDKDEDVLLLHLTSHGSEDHQLSVEFPPLQLQSITPSDVRAALDDAGIKWRIVVVSACYSGGFIDALKETHTAVVTASDATHTSFGCGNAFDFTYFSKAYFDEALRHTHSFEKAFAVARQAIAEREQKEGLESSNPQMVFGEAIQAKLSRMEKHWAVQNAKTK